MSNPYYTFTPRFVPGTKVRAGAVNAQFDLLEDAFDALPASSSAIVLGTATLGVESGSGNAYVVTMPNTRTTNASGDEVVFKATHQNSGAGTLQVDSIPAVPLVRWDGTALSSGDILADSYYVARYDSTNSHFKIVAPAQSTVVGTLTYATPSGKAKLAASAGTASTVIRSDADIAIDQTIVPTWTGVHTFTPAAVFSGGFTSAGQALNQNGTALLPAYSFSGDPNTGAYNVGADDWGVATGGTLRFDISTTAVTSTLPHLNAAGSNTAPAYSFSGDPNTGAYSVGADDWGVTTGGTLRFDISTTAITSTLPFRGANGTAGAPQYSFTNSTDAGMYRVGADTLGFSTAGVVRLTLVAGGATFAPPLYAPDGSVGAPSYSFTNDSDGGMYRITTDSIGIAAGGVRVARFLLQGASNTLFTAYGGDGTNSSFAFGVANTAQSATLFGIMGAGQAQFSDGTAGAPGLSFLNQATLGLYRDSSHSITISTGGTSHVTFRDTGSPFVDINKGPLRTNDGAAATPSYTFFNDPDTGFYRDTANQIGIALGGVSAGQIVSGTFTATGNGFSGSVTGTATYQRFGNIVVLQLPNLSGTSNATTFTVTGLPSIIQPSVARICRINAVDNGSAVVDGQTVAGFTAASGTITIYKAANASGWTNSGTKAIQAQGGAPQSLIYLV